MPHLVRRYLVFALFFVAALLSILAAGMTRPAWAKGELLEKTPFDPNAALFSSQANVDTSTQGRAPEPSTMALMGSGFLAALVRLARRSFDKFKRGFDVLVASLGLIVSLPVLLFASVLIKINSPGPVFFSQARVGRRGKIFTMWKLRTMIYNAESETGPVWALENDPRVTAVGRFLRKSRIDEIPQLVNVLKGEMSIIGPRPERPEFVNGLSSEISDYRKRLRVKPGITGLAQIRQSYDSTLLDVRRKVRWDLLYIRRMCFLTDLRILLWTISVVLTGKGAR
ncbi:MAG: sugar transferase [Candidatus Omnitrophota bacterium]